jgi:transcriptional regulator GlxA family with amidase domain
VAIAGDNGKILTSAGAAAGLDLCLHLVRRDLGGNAAAAVARNVVMPLERAGGQAQFIAHEQPSGHQTALGPLLTWIEQNLRRDLSLPVIARRAAMTTRPLSRRFREQVGDTPAQWIARARIRHAQRLLEITDFAVERVAGWTKYCAQSGYTSSQPLAMHRAAIYALRASREDAVGTLSAAAHARALDVTLVTNNTAEFGRVRSLAIENWTTPPRRKR